MRKAFAAQRAQIGIEANAGVAVPATRRLASGTLTLTGKQETGRIEPGGQFLPALLYRKFASTEGTYEGTADARDLLALLSIATSNPMQTELEPGANRYDFTLSSDRQTWTAEYGDTDHASVATGLLATGIKLAWGSTSGDSTVTVPLVGGELVDGADLTPDATFDEDGLLLTPGVETYTPSPITAENVRVFVDSSAATIGTTDVSDEVLKVSVDFSDTATLARFLSGTGAVPTRSGASVEIVAEATTRIQEIRATSQVRYVRIQWTGDLIPGTATPFSLTIDVAAQVSDHSRGDEAAVYAATIALGVVAVAGFEPKIALVTDAV